MRLTHEAHVIPATSRTISTGWTGAWGPAAGAGLDCILPGSIPRPPWCRPPTRLNGCPHRPQVHPLRPSTRSFRRRGVQSTTLLRTGRLIPCHRVSAGDGSLGGYGGEWAGDRRRLLEIKETLLAREGISLPPGALFGA